MKTFVIVTLLLFFTGLAQSQESLYIDEKGDTINKNEYLKKWRNKDLLLSTWSHIDKNGKTYYTLKKDLYLKGIFNYSETIKQLKKITNKNFKDSTTILIEYYFKDDLCTSSSVKNKWDVDRITERKFFTNPIRDELKNEEITMITLFESGIIIENKPKRKSEYYYIDKDNYFRNKFFKNPTLCGAYALFKKNGETVIRNGEYRPDQMAKHLNPEIWKHFF
ncbi:MAG: hypothetical protein ACPG41_00145 [Lacinutrix venerupis]